MVSLSLRPMVGYLVGCLSIPRDSKNIDGVTVPASNGGLPSWLFVDT